MNALYIKFLSAMLEWRHGQSRHNDKRCMSESIQLTLWAPTDSTIKQWPPVITHMWSALHSVQQQRTEWSQWSTSRVDEAGSSTSNQLKTYTKNAVAISTKPIGYDLSCDRSLLAIMASVDTFVRKRGFMAWTTLLLLALAGQAGKITQLINLTFYAVDYFKGIDI